MFIFIFGLIWTVFMTAISVPFLVSASEQEDITMNIVPLVTFAVFDLVGLVLMIFGLKKIIKDRKTEKYGLQCYGIVRRIEPTGASVNDNPEFKAVIDIVNPETMQVETVEEVIGFDHNKYPTNSYLLCKYYQGDINIKSIVSDSEVPESARQYLPVAEQGAGQNVEYSSDGEFVSIDGVLYRKS
ncbi:hypothetical protein IJ847_02200 [Candidatus Saccharibacteria bacterium]|nr:hypothetical protein [Candidatus Saccharibacteria bacterium]